METNRWAIFQRAAISWMGWMEQSHCWRPRRDQGRIWTEKASQGIYWQYAHPLEHNPLIPCVFNQAADSLMAGCSLIRDNDMLAIELSQKRHPWDQLSPSVPPDVKQISSAFLPINPAICFREASKIRVLDYLDCANWRVPPNPVYFCIGHQAMDRFGRCWIVQNKSVLHIPSLSFYVTSILSFLTLGQGLIHLDLVQNPP